jgi:CHAT domain-containing protein
MTTAAIQNLLHRFFDLLDERSLSECAALLDATRPALHGDERLWVDYLHAILLSEQAPRRWDLAQMEMEQLLTMQPPPDLLARVHLELGLIADYLGEYASAIERYQNSLALFRSLDDRVYQAKVLKNMGIAHTRAFERRQTDAAALAHALACHHESLALCRAIGDERLAATVELELGTVHKALGQWQEALLAYNARADKCRRFGWRRSLALTLNNLGEVQHHVGQEAQAEASYHEALAILDELRGQDPAAADPYEEADIQANLALALNGQGQTERARRASDHALDLVEISREPLQTEAARVGFFGTRIRIYDERVALELAHGQPERALSILERAKARVFIELLAGRASELVHRSGNAAPAETEALHKVNPLTAAEICQRLPADTVLLEYALAPGLAFVLVATRQGVDAIPLLPDLQARLERVFERGGQCLRDLTPDRGRRLRDPFVLRALYHLLIEPAAQKIAGYRRLCIIPHGALHYVPFHALMASDTPRPWLIDDVLGQEIIYAPSATVLLDYCQAKPVNPGRRAIVFHFGRDLRYARQEAATMAALLDAQTVSGEQANREAVMGQSVGCALVHFACHGSFDATAPLESGLDMADGRLTAIEVMQRLRLQAELVTLSGCETGQSHRHDGEELIGLARAFIYAGAPSVLVSLWAVDDVSTAILMERFYGGLAEGRTPADALRRAQRAVKAVTVDDLRLWLAGAGLSPAACDAEITRLDAIGQSTPAEEGRARRPFEHPYFWAPFLLVGGRLRTMV